MEDRDIKSSDAKHYFKLAAAGLIGSLPIIYVLKQRLFNEDILVINMKGGNQDLGDVLANIDVGGDQQNIGILVTGEATTAEKLNIIHNLYPDKNPAESPKNNDNPNTKNHPQIKPVSKYALFSTFIHGALSGAGVVVTEIILVYYLAQYFPKRTENTNTNDKNTNTNTNTGTNTNTNTNTGTSETQTTSLSSN